MNVVCNFSVVFTSGQGGNLSPSKLDIEVS